MKQSQKLLLGLLLALGVFLQSSTMFRCGLNYSFGMGFWGPNAHDGIWHLALANVVLTGFPPPHPTFAGHLLTNYHYFFDIVLALLHTLTKIPVVNLYFQILPVLFSFLLGLLSYLVGVKITKNFWVGFWFAFFNFFAGSFGFLVTLWRGEGIGGESMFWAMQSISSLINPPFALSLVVILLGLYLLLIWKNLKVWQIAILAFLFGILINIKVYAGIIILPSLFIYSLIKFKKGERKIFWVFIISSLISGIIFFLTNRGSSSLLVFKPLWFVDTMIEAKDRLYIPTFASARYTLLAGGGWKKLFLIETVSLILFTIGNLGMRILGFYSLGEKIIKRKIEDIEIIFIIGAGIAFIIPLFFVQKGTSWNTIQFLYYFLFFANFFAAITFSKIIKIKNKFSAGILLLTAIILTVPTTFSSLKQYWGWPPPAALSIEEQKALEYLKNLPKGIVLTVPHSPYNEPDRRVSTPIPLYLYDTTAYVAAFSKQATYLTEETNLEISGYEWQKIRDGANFFFEDKYQPTVRGFVWSNPISYIYLTGRSELPLSESEIGVKLLYQEGETRIYQVLK